MNWGKNPKIRRKRQKTRKCKIKNVKKSKKKLKNFSSRLRMITTFDHYDTDQVRKEK